MSLEIINLYKSFGDKKLFDGFSYSFSDTGIYAVIGESGIGKTTLLRMISGLDTDYAGEIIGGGIGRVSFAFQEYRLFPGLSAIENLIFTISDRKDVAVFDKCKKMLLTLGFTDNDINLSYPELIGFDGNPETVFIDKDELERVRKEIDNLLSGNEKPVLTLYLKGLSYQEIGNVLGKSVKTIDNAIQRIRRKINKYYLKK